MNVDGRSLRSEFELASNLPRPLASANWLFLLPSLELRTVVVIGRPDAELQHQLGVLAGRTIVCRRRRRERDAVAELGDDVDLVIALRAPRPATLRYIRDRSGISTFWHAPGMGPAVSVDAWLTPLDGEPPPVGDASVIGLPAPPRPRLPLPGRMRRVVRVLAAAWSRLGIVPTRSRHRAGDPDRLGSTLRWASAPPDGRRSAIALADGRPPAEWLHVVCEQHGLRVAARQWTVNFEGDYRSQKIWFRLPGASASGDVILKVGRDPRFAYRLQTELAGLRALQHVELPGSIPAPLFGATVGGVAIVAQTAVGGSPFEHRMVHAVDDHLLTTAIGWASELATRTRSLPFDPPALESTLESLLEVFGSRCAPSAQLVQRLSVDASELVTEAPPAVFVHGDLCVWNLLVDDDGTLGVLDWENADPAGLPFWDLAQLILSYVRRSLDLSGARATPERVAAACSPTSEFGRLLDGACGALADHLDLSARIVRPSVRLFAVHQAIKETARRPARQAGSVYHARLLEALVANR